MIGENPAQSEADATQARRLLEGLDFLVVQDIFLTTNRGDGRRRAPGDGVVVRGRGHGDEQRAARAARPQGARAAGRGARRHVDHRELARRLGHDWGEPTAEQVWDELRSLSPMHRRHELRAAGGARRHPVAVLRRGHPGALFLHGRLWEEPVEGPPAPFTRRRGEPPIEELDDEFPLRLTTGRRLDSYNTGVQIGAVPLAAAPRRGARPLAGGRRAARRRRRRDRAGHVAPRLASTRPCGSTRRCGRASRS